MSSYLRELFTGGSYRHQPNYYYDDGVVSYGAAGRSMHNDVVLHVPMDSMKCVERVKHALAIEGVYRVNCNINNQTVTVSGNVPPEDLLRRVRWIKSHSQILSYNNNNDYRGGSSFGSGSDYRYNNNPYANERYPTSPSFGGSDYNGYPSYIDNDSRYGSSYGSSYGGLERSYSSAYGYY